ncbi:MAG: type III pantothenate kinase [Solirubrobacterales bacterium]|nr:type III pantothenate kinase [Solirubrobacterales bacterium]
MLLAVDIGNTQTHLGAFQNGNLLEHWRLTTERDATADELASIYTNLLALRELSFTDIDDVIISSTVPKIVPEYVEMTERYLGEQCVVVGPGLKTGMPIRVENPRELGADRLVNAVAAYERLGGPCVVVDFGTAITFDAISAQGEYMGGIIAPGVEISLNALTERAAKLPQVELTEPERLIGRTTLEAIQSGVIYGFAAQIDGICERLRDELGDELQVIATGGLSSHIVPFCDSVELTDDMLTLTGLRLIYERNAS